MGTYSGRRGPDVSQYLRELNAIPAHDAPAPDEAFGMEDDLAMFTNTQFFDFDSGQNTDYNAPSSKPESVVETQRQDDMTTSGSVIGDFGMDFISGEFHLGDFGSTYTSPTIPSFSETLGNLQPLQPNPQAIYHHSAPQHHRHHPPLHAPSYPTPASQSAEKSRSDASSQASPNRPLIFEEGSRVAAEEDKRRRNTAASARFRIKKKQREQALEKSAKEMSEKVTALEGRIQQLETENKWLKNLVMEKNGGSDEIVKLWKDINARTVESTKDSGTGKNEKIGDSVTVAHSASEE